MLGLKLIHVSKGAQITITHDSYSSGFLQVYTVHINNACWFFLGSGLDIKKWFSALQKFSYAQPISVQAM